MKVKNGKEVQDSPITNNHKAPASGKK